MDTAHLHLWLNHVPIIGIIIATLWLLFAVIVKNEGIQKTALATIFLLAIISIPVFLSGEPAEKTIKHLPGVVQDLIEEHEEAAEFAFWSMLLTGLISLISLGMQMRQNKYAKTMVFLSLILGLATSSMMIRTGYLGGQIRHTEFRADFVPAQDSAPGDAEKDEEKSEKY